MKQHRYASCRTILTLLLLLGVVPVCAVNDSIPESDPESWNVVDEVIWVVGDEPILRSEVEGMRIQGEQEGMKWSGNPDCSIPEQIAIQKLFLHQAAIDSIEVTDSEVAQEVEAQLNYWIQMVGSREKLLLVVEEEFQS